MSAPSQTAAFARLTSDDVFPLNRFDCVEVVGEQALEGGEQAEAAAESCAVLQGERAHEMVSHWTPGHVIGQLTVKSEYCNTKGRLAK